MINDDDILKDMSLLNAGLRIIRCVDINKIAPNTRNIFMSFLIDLQESIKTRMEDRENKAQ